MPKKADRPLLSASAEQIARERSQAERGVQRYWSSSKRLSTSAPGRVMVREHAHRLGELIKEWSSFSEAGKALDRLGHDLSAVLTLKVMLDGVTIDRSRAGTIKVLATLFRDELLLQDMQRSHHALLERLKKTKHKTQWGLIKAANSLAERGVFDYEQVPSPDLHRAALVCTEFAVEIGLFTKTHQMRGRRKIQYYKLTPECEAWIQSGHEHHEALKPYYRVMIDPPLDWGDDQPGGYRTSLCRRMSLMRAQQKHHIPELKEADLSEVYSAVNAAQATPFEVNEDVLMVVRHLWDTNACVAGLPDREMPTGPRDDEHVRRAQKAWRNQQGMRLSVGRILSIAEEELGRSFYFPCKLDFRGRLYPVPPFLNYQGHDIARGLLRFTRREPIQDQDSQNRWYEYGATLYGKKGTRKELRSWYRDSLGLVQAIQTDPLDAVDLWSSASDPFQFLAWCLEHDSAAPRLPLSMDGTNNGLQLYSLLMRNRELAALTNVSPSDKPADIYQFIADKITAELRVRAEAGEVEAQKWVSFLGGQMPRDAVKRPIMTLPYGATRYACQEYIRDWMESITRETREHPWDWSTHRPANYLVDILWPTVLEVCAPAVACMDWLQLAAEQSRALGAPLRWTTPSGLPVIQEYPDWERLNVRAVLAKSVRWVTIKRGIRGIDSRRQRNGAAPNFIHSLDSSVLMRTLCLAKEAGIGDFAMVHDSYGVQAARSTEMAALLRQATADIFSQDILDSVWQQFRLFTPDLPPPPERGDLDPTCVTESVYFF